MIRKKYQQLGIEYILYLNSIMEENYELQDKCKEVIIKIIDSLPHGSGIDGDTTFDFEHSTKHKLIINSSYHCMDNNGYYDGWINFKIIIEPGWVSPRINLKCRNGSIFRKKYYFLKEYILDLFYEDLTQEWAQLVETK